MSTNRIRSGRGRKEDTIAMAVKRIPYPKPTPRQGLWWYTQKEFFISLSALPHWAGQPDSLNLKAMDRSTNEEEEERKTKTKKKKKERKKE